MVTTHFEFAGDQSIVLVVENYAPDRMRAVIDTNPQMFPAGERRSLRVLMTWHSYGRFLKWTFERRRPDLVRWMCGMRLAC